MEWKELKQIERQLILYDIFRTNDEDTRLSTIRYHLPGINIRTLQRDINDLMDAELIQVYYSRDIGAYINYIDDRDFSCYPEGIQKRIAEKRKETVTKKELSTKKQEHIKRLKRLAELMCSEVYEKADEYYFSLFPFFMSFIRLISYYLVSRKFFICIFIHKVHKTAGAKWRRLCL